MIGNTAFAENLKTSWPFICRIGFKTLILGNKNVIK